MKRVGALCLISLMALVIWVRCPVEARFEAADKWQTVQVEESAAKHSCSLSYAPKLVNSINGLNARGAILVNYDTGQIIYAKHEQERFHPASITKLMVLYIVLEKIHQGLHQWEEPVQISEKVERVNEAQVYLKKGEVLSLQELVKAMMVASANDAAVALAEKVAGSEEAFVRIMNQRAVALGLTNSHFINASGLPGMNNANHYMSAYDIALLTKIILEEYPEALDFSRLKTTTIRNGAYPIKSTNNLLELFAGADGLKTGYTDKARWCLVATAQREDQRFISVVMGSPTKEIRSANTVALLDYGFQQYQRVKAIYINGEQSKLNQKPIFVAGTVLAPVRCLTDTMSLNVEYDQEEILITGQGTQVKFQVGSNRAAWNNQSVELTQPVQRIKGNIMVPLRFLTQAFGGDIQWDKANKVIHINLEHKHVI
ncbi:stalk domain-containing protein [Desulfotomaculum sp. 1211_IL3151]|uniref:stalk domain-containing protein n=1 Tax=Desulfotomaculum sp. 1211_IL3151 TaxID=3084055 RepID=UPI002FDB8DA1